MDSIIFLNRYFFLVNILNISPAKSVPHQSYISFSIYLQNTVFGGEPTKPDYNFVPYAVFW